MPGPTANTVCTVIPGLRDRDAAATIEWLCTAFGFEKHRVVPDDRGGIAHVQLTIGPGMIMPGSADDSAWGRRIVRPQDIGGRENPCPVVADCDACCARARAAGAVIVDPLESMDCGGNGCSCRDPEGHLWWFGRFDSRA